MACARMNEHAPREMNQCTPHECTPYHKGPLPYTNLWSICMYSTIFKWRYRSLLQKIVCFIGLFSNQCTLRLRWRVHGWMRAHHVSADQLDEWVHIISLCDSSIYPFMTHLYVYNRHFTPSERRPYQMKERTSYHCVTLPYTNSWPVYMYVIRIFLFFLMGTAALYRVCSTGLR